jgi:hypothetical protein
MEPNAPPPEEPQRGILLICSVCRQDLLAADVTEAEKAARPDVTAMMCANPLCPCGRIYMIRKPQPGESRVEQVVNFLRQLEQRVKFDRAQAEDIQEQGLEPPPLNPLQPPAPPPMNPRPPYVERKPGEPWWRHLFGEEPPGGPPPGGHPGP